MTKPLPQHFFNRSTHTVARELLGTRLVRAYRGKLIAQTITEVEVYDGFEDKASHAHRGKTPRTAVMFGPPGHWYVYLVYGMHWMLNVVTREEGYPAAVLIRGTSEVSGPARLTKALHIRNVLNGKAAAPHSRLWVEGGRSPRKAQIARLPRVGVDYAGAWAKKPWRYVLKTRT